jgi:hypothetical protein
MNKSSVNYDLINIFKYLLVDFIDSSIRNLHNINLNDCIKLLTENLLNKEKLNRDLSIQIFLLCR